MATEGVELHFTLDGIRQMAEYAYHVNESTENIGARRLHTVLERLLEDVSFGASKLGGQSVTIDAAYVTEKLGHIANNDDLSRYVL